MLIAFPGLTSDNTADPNWLLSSTAQCGAALVAIVAGLLVSRLLGLRSERATHSRAAEQYRDRENKDREQRDSLQEQLERQRALAWVTVCLPQIVRAVRASNSDGITVHWLIPPRCTRRSRRG